MPPRIFHSLITADDPSVTDDVPFILSLASIIGADSMDVEDALGLGDHELTSH